MKNQLKQNKLKSSRRGYSQDTSRSIFNTSSRKNTVSRQNNRFRNSTIVPKTPATLATTFNDESFIEKLGRNKHMKFSQQRNRGLLTSGVSSVISSEDLVQDNSIPEIYQRQKTKRKDRKAHLNVDINLNRSMDVNKNISIVDNKFDIFKTGLKRNNKDEYSKRIKSNFHSPNSLI